MIALLGPVSSATPNGGGAIGNWFEIAVGAWVLITAWRRFRNRVPDTNVPIYSLVGITLICTVIIGVGVWGLFN